MGKRKKIIVAKISEDKKQKRLTVPKQEETEDWKHNDSIKLEKVE